MRQSLLPSPGAPLQSDRQPATATLSPVIAVDTIRGLVSGAAAAGELGTVATGKGSPAASEQDRAAGGGAAASERTSPERSTGEKVSDYPAMTPSAAAALGSGSAAEAQLETARAATTDEIAKKSEFQSTNVPAVVVTEPELQKAAVTSLLGAMEASKTANGGMSACIDLGPPASDETEALAAVPSELQQAQDKEAAETGIIHLPQSRNWQAAESAAEVQAPVAGGGSGWAAEAPAPQVPTITTTRAAGPVKDVSGTADLPEQPHQAATPAQLLELNDDAEPLAVWADQIASSAEAFANVTLYEQISINDVPEPFSSIPSQLLIEVAQLGGGSSVAPQTADPSLQSIMTELWREPEAAPPLAPHDASAAAMAATLEQVVQAAPEAAVPGPAAAQGPGPEAARLIHAPKATEAPRPQPPTAEAPPAAGAAEEEAHHQQDEDQHVRLGPATNSIMEMIRRTTASLLMDNGGVGQSSGAFGTFDSEGSLAKTGSAAADTVAATAGSQLPRTSLGSTSRFRSSVSDDWTHVTAADADSAGGDYPEWLRLCGTCNSPRF